MKPTTIEQVFGRYFGVTKDQAGHYWTCDVTEQLTEALATIEQLVLERVINHKHNGWCFLHCPYKSTLNSSPNTVTHENERGEDIY